MAKKTGNTLIKLVVLLAVGGAVFFALDSWRKKAGVADNVEAPASGPARSLSREEAERIGTDIGTRIGTEIGTQIGREVAAEMLAERQTQLAASQPAAAQPVPAPTPEPMPESAPAPEPAPAPVQAEAPTPSPAPAAEDTNVADADVEQTPAPKPAAKKEEAQGKIPGLPVAQPAAGRDPWWTKSNTGDPEALVLTYAGNFKSSDGSQTGIALMFTGRFDKQTDFSPISVSGNVGSAKWQLGVNRGLIYLPGVPVGSYTVTVGTGFRDADGKSLKSEVSGPIDVQ